MKAYGALRSAGPSALAQATSTRPSDLLRQRIINEIRKSPNRRITFASFMQFALFDQDYGYYASGKVKIGDANSQSYDFSTNPERYFPSYSYVLAASLTSMWYGLGCPETFRVVEMGAGNGTMAKGILDYFKKYDPEMYKRIRYTIVEVSPSLARKQKQTCLGHSVQHVIGSALAPPLAGIEGVIFSNELPDAFPVHRIKYNDRPELSQEIYIIERDGQLTEIEGPLSSREIVDYISKAKPGGEAGAERVVNLNMVKWLKDLNQILKKGYILTIDYASLFSDKGEEPVRLFSEGCQPHVSESYNFPGEQDMTADIHYDVYCRVAEDLGLKPLFVGSEARFFGVNGGVWEKYEGSFFVLFHSKNVAGQYKRQGSKVIMMPHSTEDVPAATMLISELEKIITTGQEENVLRQMNWGVPAQQIVQLKRDFPDLSQELPLDKWQEIKAQASEFWNKEAILSAKTLQDKGFSLSNSPLKKTSEKIRFYTLFSIAKKILSIFCESENIYDFVDIEARLSQHFPNLSNELRHSLAVGLSELPQNIPEVVYLPPPQGQTLSPIQIINDL